MDAMKPEWFDEWVIFTPGNWQLRDGAPADVVTEFKEFMQQLDQGSCDDLCR
ncbi:hypothetical protein [Metabacillus sp. Hm71]|uniref:hypothetical protein n=1 Tax=Metabacillus sp. Hm71 TaxID=3450743 RepID=UPI003F43A199